MIRQFSIDYIVNTVVTVLPDPAISFLGSLDLLSSTGIIYLFGDAGWVPLQVPDQYTAYVKDTGKIVNIDRNLILQSAPNQVIDPTIVNGNCNCKCNSSVKIPKPSKLFVDQKGNLYQYNCTRKGWDLLINNQSGLSVTLTYDTPPVADFQMPLTGNFQIPYSISGASATASVIAPFQITGGIAHFNLTGFAEGVYTFNYRAYFVNETFTVSTVIFVSV